MATIGILRPFLEKKAAVTTNKVRQCVLSVRKEGVSIIWGSPSYMEVTMTRLICMIVLALFLFTACSNESSVPEEEIQTENTMENIAVTHDGKITFEIFNNVGVAQEKVESIKEELLHAYTYIEQSIHTNYVPSNKINVLLLEGHEASWGLRSEIKLYNIRENKYPLVHELTHSLLGYGEYFDTSKGYFTQEGFATYMENKYGRQIAPVL